MTAISDDPAAPLAHPEPSRLAAFGRGTLEEGEWATIAAHLSACVACRSAVEGVADDTLAMLFRRAVGEPAAAGAPEATGAGPRGAAPPSGYVVLEVLGEGGMAVVSKARQVALGRVVALKEVRPEVLAGRDGVARFRREAEAAARLRHPNIVTIHDVGWRGEVPYLAMEYVEGGTLARLLAGGPLAPRDAARLVEALAGAVQHAHEAGVVHRDLKPANILLAPDLDHPKVADFGLAQLDGDATRTGSGVLLGTPGYMSPEQAGGDPSAVGPATDIHALGAVLYEALTGRPPFPAATALEALERIRSAEPVPPRRLRAGIPRDLETIALKCLEKAPGRRYTSARALADDLRRWLAGEPIAARSTSGPERLARWARRRPWQATSAALGALAVLGALGGTLAHNARLRAEVARADREAAEARAQRSRAERQYRSAREAIRRMIGRLDEPRAVGKRLDDELAVRLKFFEDALAFYEGAGGDGPDAPARLDEVHTLLDFATIQIMAARPADAERALRRASDRLEALEADGARDPDVVRLRVSCLIKRATALGLLGRPDEAMAAHREAIARAERSGSDRVEDREDLAWAQANLGSALLAGGRPAEAVGPIERSIEIRRALVASDPDRVELRERLAVTRTNLAIALARLGERGRADAEFAAADADLGPIVRAEPGRNEGALALGNLGLVWGGLALEAGQIDRAIGRFRDVLGPVDAVLRATPDWSHAKRVACQLRAALATALDQAGRHGEAVAEWDRAVALADPGGDDARTYRLARLIALARRGAGAEILAEAEALAADRSRAPSGVDFYNLACVAAVVASAEAGRSAERAEAAALRAIGWLERAREAGALRDPGMRQYLDRDPDLAALRDRDDFRSLRLDAAFPADPFRSDR
jgi:eukaryotic-like serine/threonine-protein kinase